MAKKQTIIKKPVGKGNISITIENNLKNINQVPTPVVVKKRRRRQPTSATTDVTNSKIEDMLKGGGGGVNLPPLKDVSYIKPPSNNFTVWRNHMNDSFNTTVPIQNAITEGQARQMGLLPPPSIIQPTPSQPLGLTDGLSPATDTPLTMREFAMIMMQQGQNGVRHGYQNLHHDPYNQDEPMHDRYANPIPYNEHGPMEDIYANLRPSSRIEEINAIDESILRDNGVTEEQIKNYQEQIQQQQKASVRTTNEQKLATAGLNPEIIQTVAKIAAIKTAGTWQGKRNIKPNGPHMDDPHFIASYNASRTIMLNQQPTDRKTAKDRNKKYTFLGEGEDPWDNLGSDLSSEEMRRAKIKELVDKQNAEDQARNEMYDPPATTINNAIRGHLARKKVSKDMKDMKDMRQNQVIGGLRKDPEIEEKVNADVKKVMQESNSAKILTRAIKGHNARKEATELQENKRIDELDEQIRQERKQKKQAEEKAAKVITKAAQRYKATKEKKAFVQKTKEALQAEIATLQEELKAGSREQKEPSVKSKGINKALGSIKDFWLADMTQEEARKARIDARQAKKDAQKESEDNLAAKIKALKDKRKQLESLGK